MSLWHVHSRAVVFQPFTEVKETLEYLPIELRLYGKPFWIITPLIIYTCSIVPTPAIRITSMYPLLITL